MCIFIETLNKRIEKSNINVKRLTVENVVAKINETPKFNKVVGYGDSYFFKITNTNYINLQLDDFKLILAIRVYTFYIVTKLAFFMIIDKKFLNYANNVLSYFRKNRVYTYKDIKNMNDEELIEYKKMILNYLKLLHKAYKYCKYYSPNLELKNSDLKYGEIFLTQEKLMDYYLIILREKKQRIQIRGKRILKAIKSKLHRHRKNRIKKIKKLKISMKEIALYLSIKPQELLEIDNNTDRLKALSIYMSINLKYNKKN